ncbi:MAG: ADP-glyceromanno-heptose 6-epimerase [Phycisphaerae bacterium]|nr:ADP-glyceromanno-heptose 6-epimerase [Phycisphaerae bacterium]
MSYIVVTGGAGFIGSGLIWGLNQRGFDNIIVTDVLGTDEKWKNLANLRFADYFEKDDFLTKLQAGDFAGQIDGIIHMGACSATDERDISYLMNNNFGDTKRLAQWSIDNSKRFVYASSAATYGNGEKGFSDSHDGLDTLKPINGYAFSKWQFDLWAKRKGVLNKMAGLKFFNVFGPNEYHKDGMRSVVNKAYDEIKATGGMKLFKSDHPDFGDGGQSRDFVYIKYVVDATLAVYNAKDANGIFNLGTGVARSFKDLTVATFQAMGLEPNISYIDMPDKFKGKYQYYTCAEMEKLRKVYPDMPWTLEESVKDYVQNYLMQDDGYLKVQ